MKIFRIALILLFLIMSMGLVSAQDNLTDTMQADTCSTEEVGSFEELEYDISHANDTLEITKDYINDDHPNGIAIERDNLVINGNNRTIDGNGQNIFLIMGSNITINNLVFKNAYYDDNGGAICNYGAIALNNVTFINNGAGMAGGAIFNLGTIDLYDTVFINNSAEFSAGAIYNGGVLALSNVSFADNFAELYGGAIFNEGWLAWNNVSFADNFAELYGGAIYNGGVIAWNNVYFDDDFEDESGGGMFDLNNVYFDDDFEDESGGGMFDLNNVSFVANGAVKGGAIYNSGVMELYGAGFIDNFADESGGAIYSGGGLALSDVSFVANGAVKGGAIYNSGVMELYGAGFIDNFAEDSGGAIYNGGGVELSISDAFFSSEISDNLGQIYCDYSKMNIYNSTFLNITSSYAPALFILTSDVSIFDSSFVNLAADITAGAIAIKNGGNYYIEGCEFINTTSSKNAGALNIDITGMSNLMGNVSIVDTLFKDTYSDFGGALIQLGGNLCVNNSNFIDNGATYNGGSVYISYVDAEINNCTFDSNGIKALENITTCGSAIYCDISNLTLSNSRIINKSKESGSAVYACDSSYTIVNSVFMGNANAIYTDFDKVSNLANNVYSNGSVSTNNTYLKTIMVGEGVQLKLLNNSINVTNIPSRFDLRDWNWTSPVRYQGLMGACWVFVVTGALESSLRKTCGITTDFSINNMQKTMIRYSNYGVDYWENGVPYTVEGGIPGLPSAYLVSWLGAFPQDYDMYDEVGKISRAITTGEDIHIQDLIFVYNDEPGSLEMKSAILKYGSLGASVYLASANEQYFNPETNALYVNDNLTNDHSVEIVGWDDNYPKDNFLITPPRDGAWIVKNSWGTDWGDNGYLYLSYYDKSLLREYLGDNGNMGFKDILACGVIVENTIPYNKNYQYDVGWYGDFDDCKNVTYANVFEALDDDLIAAVGTYFNSSNADYRVDVYVNGELKLSQGGSVQYPGFHTIKLDEYVSIKAGDVFSAAITSDLMPIIRLNCTRVHYTQGLSYKVVNGSWIDLYDDGEIACLKVYTVADDSRIIDNTDILVDYGKKSWFSVKVVTSDGHTVVGEDVNFTINGKTKTVKTDSDGIAKIKITEVPGTYVLTTVYNGQSYENNVTVRLDLENSKVVAKNIAVDYAGGSYFTAKVLSSDGKVAVGGKSVIFVFNGKVITAKTDKNGIAKIKITQAPGKYTIKTIFNGKTYTNKITVKHVLTASKVTVKKTSKKFTLKARLKINGKLVKGKWITFKFNGKTYKAKTNFKGIAQKTFNRNVIKNLKKGRTYAVRVVYAKDVIKTTVKVR